METDAERQVRQGRFAEYVLGQPEWSELLEEAKNSIVGEWMHGSTPEQREQAHAKVKALASTHALLSTWQDRKKVLELQAEQAQGTSAL